MVEGINPRLVDPGELEPGLETNTGLEEAFTEFYNYVVSVRNAFMAHPNRDSYREPLRAGFELPDATRLVVRTDLRSRVYSKSQELTAGTEGIVRSGFVAKMLEIAVVGKPDLDDGVYQEFGISPQVGDRVAILTTETDAETEMYERTMVVCKNITFEFLLLE